MNTLAWQLHAFAAHVRDPDAHAAPKGIEARRMAIYRRLVRTNLHALLSTNFPVIRRILPGERWNALVDGFLSGHVSRSPLFTRIGGEFVDYLQRRATEAGDPAWLPELAHYEWVELALQIDDSVLPPHDPAGDLQARIPVLSPLAWPLAYRWPVHRIGPEHVPTQPGNTATLLLLRRGDDGDVRFSELSPLVFRLLQLIDQDGTAIGAMLLARLADEARPGDRDAFMQEGLAMLQRLRDEGTLLGTRP